MKWCLLDENIRTVCTVEAGSFDEAMDIGRNKLPETYIVGAQSAPLTIEMEELKAKVRRKLERVRKGGPMNRREEGYEEALLAVLSMIHEIENRRNGQ